MFGATTAHHMSTIKVEGVTIPVVGIREQLKLILLVAFIGVISTADNDIAPFVAKLLLQHWTHRLHHTQHSVGHLRLDGEAS